ncbi:hypothetical protein ACLB1O_30850 [Escherichia coli]
MCSVGDLLPRSGGYGLPGRRKTLAGLRLPETAGGPRLRRCPSCPSWCEAFFCYVVSVVLISGGGDTFGSPAAWRHPVVRPDSYRQLLAHPPVSAEPAGAVSGCRYGPMSTKRAGSDRSGRAAPVAPETALPAHLTVCKATAPDGAVNPSAATPAACFPLWTFRGLEERHPVSAVQGKIYRPQNF